MKNIFLISPNIYILVELKYLIRQLKNFLAKNEKIIQKYLVVQKTFCNFALTKKHIIDRINLHMMLRGLILGKIKNIIINN